MVKKSKKNIPKINNTNTGAPIFPFGPSPINNSQPINDVSFLENPVSFIHNNIMYLNNSKFFAGIVMILLNVGSKFISIQFSKSTEEYLKYTLSKQILVFAMAWMATRDIYTALSLTAIFVILSEHLFNEESRFCIVPHSSRVLHKLLDTNNDGIVSETEINNAISILEKAKKEKQQKIQKDAYNKLKSYDNNMGINTEYK
jgi:hypothetical protein